MKPFVCTKCGYPLDALSEIVHHRIYECPCDSDGTEGGDANAAPVPQDCQARPEGIAR